MTSRHRLHTALAGAFFSMAVAAAVAAPQVVGDDACARYAVDIESFATCEDGNVVRPEAVRASTLEHGVRLALQVVGDEACARYAVDIESFATCEGATVVRPEAAPASPATRGVHVALQVVGDEACARYAVDIESFATCEDGRVVRPAAEAIGGIPAAPVAVAQRR